MVSRSADGREVTTVEYKFVGTNLWVKPHVTDNGSIYVEFSYQATRLDDENSQPPTFSSTDTQVAFVMTSNQTAWIAGLDKTPDDTDAKETILFMTCSILQ